VVTVHASPLGRLGHGENGGMNLAVRRFCEELAARGIPSDVFTRRDDPRAPAEELIAPGSRLVRLEAGPPRVVPKHEVVAHLPSFTSALLAHAESERRRYRLLHSHYWLSGWVASRARQRWDVPWVQSFHTLARLKEAAGLPPELQRAQAEEVLARGADRLVAMSAAEERALVELYDVDPDRVCVVPPGVDAEQFGRPAPAALRAELGLGGRRVVFAVGRLERLKGFDLLLEAVARLRLRPGFDDVVLLCAGADSGDGSSQAAHPDGERGRLESRAWELGLAGAVRFLGAVDGERLAALYALADVCAVPSMTETFGLVALEAQAAGTPVVASAVGGLVDTVADGQSGRLVDGRDPDDFATALAEVLGDEGLRRRLGEAARERAAGFTWSLAAERLLHLYDCVEEALPEGALETCACL